MEEMLDDMIANSNDRFFKLKDEDKLATDAKAFISGSFTDW